MTRIDTIHTKYYVVYEKYDGGTEQAIFKFKVTSESEAEINKVAKGMEMYGKVRRVNWLKYFFVKTKMIISNE